MTSSSKGLSNNYQVSPNGPKYDIGFTQKAFEAQKHLESQKALQKRVEEAERATLAASQDEHRKDLSKVAVQNEQKLFNFPVEKSTEKEFNGAVDFLVQLVEEMFTRWKPGMPILQERKTLKISDKEYSLHIKVGKNAHQGLIDDVATEEHTRTIFAHERIAGLGDCTIQAKLPIVYDDIIKKAVAVLKEKQLNDAIQYLSKIDENLNENLPLIKEIQPSKIEHQKSFLSRIREIFSMIFTCGARSKL